MNHFNAKDHWENILVQNYGLHGTGYLRLGRHYNNWLYKVKLKSFFRTIRSLKIENIKSMNIIDIGSGTGFVIEAWKKLGIGTVTGVDITNVAVQNLKRKFPDDKFYRLDISDAPVKAILDEQYDFASSLDVLYHIVDDNRYLKALENIYSLLRNGGYLIFSENFLHRKTKRGTDQVDRRLSDVEEILGRIGFQIEKRVPEFVLMNNPVDADNFRSLLWLGMMLPVQKSELVGNIYGALLYPMEIFLTSCLRESPTTEIMVCRK